MLVQQLINYLKKMERYYQILSITAVFILTSLYLKDNNKVFEYRNVNHLTEFPDSLITRFDFQIVKIYGNECDISNKECKNFTQLPEVLKSLSKLEELYFVMNNLYETPKFLVTLKKLKVLDLSSNRSIKNLKSLDKLTSLEVLNLNDCNLNTVPEGIFLLKNLKVLGLEGNYFSDDMKATLRKKLSKTEIYF